MGYGNDLRAVPLDGTAAQAVEGYALRSCGATDAPEIVVEGVGTSGDRVPLTTEVGSRDQSLGRC